jgi:hypothetical protein
MGWRFRKRLRILPSVSINLPSAVGRSQSGITD